MDSQAVHITLYPDDVAQMSAYHCPLHLEHQIPFGLNWHHSLSTTFCDHAIFSRRLRIHLLAYNSAWLRVRLRLCLDSVCEERFGIDSDAILAGLVSGRSDPQVQMRVFEHKVRISVPPTLAGGSAHRDVVSC